MNTAKKTHTDGSLKLHSRLITIVSPVHNEEGNLVRFHAAITKVLRDMNAESSETRYEHELIFVNDGSKDASWERIVELCQRDTRVKGICLSRNFGQMSALEAGIEAAQGNCIVTLDCDLEDPPTLIKDMVKAWEAGNEIVVAKRVYRNERSWLKRKTSDLFYWLFNKVSDIELETGMSEFRLLDREVVRVINTELKEREMFLRGMISWLGYRMTSISYEKGERDNGETSFTFRRMLRLAWGGLTAFSSFPLLALVVVGTSITGLSILVLIGMSVLRWGTETVIFTDIAFLVVFIILSNGIMLSALGLISLYIIRIHEQVLGRPNFIVWKKMNF